MKMAFPCMSGFHTSWTAYLVNMAQDHAFSDQLTLFAAANLFNVNIQIVSSLSTGASHVFQLTSSIPIATLFLSHFAENHGEHYIALNSLSDEDGDEIPAESVNYVQRGNQNEIDENNEDDGDEIAKNASTQAEEIREMENDNDDHDMSADSAASQAVKGSAKQGEGESDNYDNDEAPKRLPNELAPVVQRLDNANHRINRYPVDKC